jgi:1-acyl-sn-glycerol-3-phosphate acyltransferase
LHLIFKKKALNKFLKYAYSFWVMLVFIVMLLGGFPVVLLVMLLPQKKRIVVMHHLMQGFSWVWFFFVGIYSKFYNKHLIKEGESSILIPNHSSYLDAALIYRAVDQVFLTLGKIEIAKVPLFGLIYKTIVVLVDRSSTIAKAKSFLQMTSVLEQGIDIIIFPEGTFDEQDGDLKPFFDGAFRLAMHAKKPLLPILFVDARERLHASSIFSFTPGKCRVVYLPPIETVGLPKNSQRAIKDYAYNYMNTMLNYCRANGCEDSLAVAEKWRMDNPLVIEEMKK